ncbi:MAG: hypothetical protein HC853_00285 [Anaerolineae bacterium]|nr:hypothetical protein [Anaerolineae bacterium]
MQDILNLLDQWWQRLQDLVLPALYWMRARIGVETATTAVIAAGGMLILLIGLFSTKRVNLHGEAAHLEGVHEPGMLERLQTKLYQSGIRIKVREFLAVGIMLGVALGGLFIVLGFVSIGVAFGLSGPFLYYQFLMGRRIKELRVFRDELPMAILDTRDHLTMRANDVRGAMLAMSERGPGSLRIDFDYAYRLMSGGAGSEPLALREVSRKREEPFFRQFFDALANHHKGGDTAAVLTRIAQGQKTHNRLQAKTRAKQSGLRLVGTLYLIAPPLFAVFMALSGGPESVAFYASLDGQLVQLLAVLSGIVSYWLSHKIAMRGLYMDEVTRVRLDTEQVPAYVASDEFGESQFSEPMVLSDPVAEAHSALAAATLSNSNGHQNGYLANHNEHMPLNGAATTGSPSVADVPYDLEPVADDDEDDDVPSIETLSAFQNFDWDELFDAPSKGQADGSANDGVDEVVENVDNFSDHAEKRPWSTNPIGQTDQRGGANSSASTNPLISPPGGPNQVAADDFDAAEEANELDDELDFDQDDAVGASDTNHNPPQPPAATHEKSEQQRWARPQTPSKPAEPPIGPSEPNTTLPSNPLTDADAPLPPALPLYARKRTNTKPDEGGR